MEGIREVCERMGIAAYCRSIGSIGAMALGVTEEMNDYRDTLRINRADYLRLRKGCLERGIRIHPSRGRLYTSTAHTSEDVDKTLTVVDKVIGETFRRSAAAPT